jgi:hypothetical protein
MTNDPWMFGLHIQQQENISDTLLKMDAAESMDMESWRAHLRVFVADRFSIDFWFVQSDPHDS